MQTVVILDNITLLCFHPPSQIFIVKFKTRVVGAAAYLLLALMDHFEIDVGPPSSDLERPFEP